MGWTAGGNARAAQVRYANQTHSINLKQDYSDFKHAIRRKFSISSDFSLSSKNNDIHDQIDFQAALQERNNFFLVKEIPKVKYAELTSGLGVLSKGIFQIKQKTGRAMVGYGFLIGWKIGITMNFLTKYNFAGYDVVFSDGSIWEIEEDGCFISDLSYTIFQIRGRNFKIERECYFKLNYKLENCDTAQVLFTDRGPLLTLAKELQDFDKQHKVICNLTEIRLVGCPVVTTTGELLGILESVEENLSRGIVLRAKHIVKSLTLKYKRNEDYSQFIRDIFYVSEIHNLFNSESLTLWYTEVQDDVMKRVNEVVNEKQKDAESCQYHFKFFPGAPDTYAQDELIELPCNNHKVCSDWFQHNAVDYFKDTQSLKGLKWAMCDVVLAPTDPCEFVKEIMGQYSYDAYFDVRQFDISPPLSHHSPDKSKDYDIYKSADLVPDVVQEDEMDELEQFKQLKEQLLPDEPDEQQPDNSEEIKLDQLVDVEPDELEEQKSDQMKEQKPVELEEQESSVLEEQAWAEQAEYESDIFEEQASDKLEEHKQVEELEQDKLEEPEKDESEPSEVEQLEQNDLAKTEEQEPDKKEEKKPDMADENENPDEDN